MVHSAEILRVENREKNGERELRLWGGCSLASFDDETDPVLIDVRVTTTDGKHFIKPLGPHYTERRKKKLRIR
jgi:hypothetical protein